MEQLKSHVPFIREMISNVKTAEYRKKWENMLNMIVSEENLSASQIEIINQNIVKAKQFKLQYESKSPQLSPEQPSDSPKAEIVSVEKKTVRYPEKRRLNELKKLQENIVKDEVILSKRVSKRATFSDYLEEKDLVVRRRKSDYVLMRRNESPEKQKNVANDPEEEVAAAKTPQKRSSLPAKLPEDENKVKKVRLDGKLVSVVMDDSKDGENKNAGRKIKLDGKPARVVDDNLKDITTPVAKKRGRKRIIKSPQNGGQNGEQMKSPLISIPKENVKIKTEPVERSAIMKSPSEMIKSPQIKHLKPKIEEPAAKAVKIEKVPKKLPEHLFPIKVRAADSKPHTNFLKNPANLSKNLFNLPKSPGNFPKTSINLHKNQANTPKSSVNQPKNPTNVPKKSQIQPEKESTERKLTSLQMFCKKIQKQHEKKTKKSFRNALLKKRIVANELKNITDEDDDDEWEDLEDEKITETSQEASDDEEIQQPVFKKVENISYSADGSLTFKCLVASCNFMTENNELFLDHLEDNHMDIKWTGFCGICDEMVSNKQRSIVFELMHMRENHVLKEEKKETSKNVEENITVNEPTPERWLKVRKEPKTESCIRKQPTTEKSAVKKTPDSWLKNKPTLEKLTTKERSPERWIKMKPTPEQKQVKKPEKVQAMTFEKITTSPGEVAGSKIKKHIIMKPPPPSPPAPVVETPQTPEPADDLPAEKQTLGTIDLLRPWCKRKIKKFVVPATQMLSGNALVAKYKCMAKLCSFYTSDMKLFDTHLKFHESFAPADKDYMNCAYCDREFVKSKVADLIKHINVDHCFDKFACSYCFYRSCANFNVLAHQKIYHNTKNKLIYELNSNKTRDYGKEFESIIEMRSRVVHPIYCLHCREKFFTFQELRFHLKSHEAKMQAKCMKCKIQCNNETMIQHLVRCFRLGVYQCIYCFYGTNTFQTICDHVADNHSSKIPVFCERTKQEGATGGLATVASLCIKHISQIVDSRIVQKCSIDDDSLKNEEHVMHLGGNIKIQRVTNSFKKVKGTPRNAKKNNDVAESSKLQIQNVFSLSDLKSD